MSKHYFNRENETHLKKLTSLHFEIFKQASIIISFDFFRNVKEISDSKASTGRVLQLNTGGKMVVLHP